MLRVPALAGAAIALGACGPTSMLDPAGEGARHSAAFAVATLSIAAVVAVSVLTLLGVALFRRGGRPGTPVTEAGPRGALVVGIAGGIVPAVVLVLFYALSLTVTAALVRPNPADLVVEVVGHDWWWEFRYPGTAAVTANELHIPAGRRVELRLSSADAIHSFWVPALQGKTDVLPGQVNTMWIEADAPGEYRGACAEYCGVQHAWMRILVIAEDPAVFDRWLANEGQPAEPGGSAGATAFLDEICATCHTIRGTAARGGVGPDLTHVGARETIGAGVLRNTPDRLRDWLADPQHYKPGALMPQVGLSDAELDALVDYLEGLH